MTPPIRFLATAFGSWACLRGAMLVPWGWGADYARGGRSVDLPQAGAEIREHGGRPRHEAQRVPGVLPRPELRPQRARASDSAGSIPLPWPAAAPPGRRAGRWVDASGRRIAPQAYARIPELRPYPLALLSWSLAAAPPRLGSAPAGTIAVPLISTRGAPPPLSRWSASAWVYGRGGDAPALAAGGLLGGSQAGARLGYRFSPRLMVTGRISAPLRAAGAEAAIGAEWQPARSLPLRLLAERRQGLDQAGRSAFAVTAHGGVGEVSLPAGFRLDAYAQAGVVGTRSRDLFAEVSARASTPVSGGLSLGAGVWAAAQPGAARLDAGPSVTFRLPQLGASLSADWRFRAAGGASPGSGPAITLWKDF